MADENELTTRIVSFFFVLGFGAIGYFLPIFLTKKLQIPKDSPWFTIAKSFGAGVVLATAYCHVLPDAHEDFEKALPDSKYPISELVGLCGTLCTLLLELAIHRIASRFQKKEIIKKNSDNYINLGDNAQDEEEEKEDTSTGRAANNTALVYVLELGIAVHSLVIGITLGCQTKSDRARALAIALCVHQCCEGAALSIIVSLAHMKSFVSAVLGLVFAFTTPLGIPIGILVSNYEAKNAFSLRLTQGILNSFSFGILMYMALVDMLAEDFSSLKHDKPLKEAQVDGEPPAKSRTSLIIFALFGGVTIMAILAIWA